MFVPRSVDRLRPNKDRQTCQASPRRLNTRASRSAPSSVAHPLGRVAPARLPRRCTELPLRRPANRAGIHYRKESSPGDPRAPGPSNDGVTDHAPARRVRPPSAASGRLPATNGGTEDLLPALSLARSRSPVSQLLAPRPPSSLRSSTKAPILRRFASSRLLSSLRGAPGSFATTTPF